LSFPKVFGFRDKEMKPTQALCAALNPFFNDVTKKTEKKVMARLPAACPLPFPKKKKKTKVPPEVKRVVPVKKTVPPPPIKKVPLPARAKKVAIAPPPAKKVPVVRVKKVAVPAKKVPPHVKKVAVPPPPLKKTAVRPPAHPTVKTGATVPVKVALPSKIQTSNVVPQEKLLKEPLMNKWSLEDFDIIKSLEGRLWGSLQSGGEKHQESIRNEGDGILCNEQNGGNDTIQFKSRKHPETSGLV